MLTHPLFFAEREGFKGTNLECLALPRASKCNPKMKKLSEQLFFCALLYPQTSLVHHRAQKKRALSDSSSFWVAEREGFEPPEPLSSTVFKTAAIDHSAISPSSECACRIEFALRIRATAIPPLNSKPRASR